MIYNPRFEYLYSYLYICSFHSSVAIFFDRTQSTLNLFKSKEILTKKRSFVNLRNAKGSKHQNARVKMVKTSVHSSRNQNSIGIPSLSSELIIVFVVTLSRAFQLQKNHWPIVSQNPFTHSTDTFRCS